FPYTTLFRSQQISMFASCTKARSGMPNAWYRSFVSSARRGLWATRKPRSAISSSTPRRLRQNLTEVTITVGSNWRFHNRGRQDVDTDDVSSAAATRGLRSLNPELRIPAPKHGFQFAVQDLGPGLQQ